MPTTPRLGFLYPGHAAEDEYPTLGRMLSKAVDIDVVHTALGEQGDAHTVESLRDMGTKERLSAGAAVLRRRRADAVVWACTSGSFVYGWGGAREQVAALEADVGAPTSSTSLAFVHAANVLGTTRVAIAATYPDDVAACFVELLRAAGIEVVHLSTSGIMTAGEAGDLGPEGTFDMVATADHPGAEAVLVPDTALHSIEIIPRLESALGKPVLTANQVSVWEALWLAKLSATADAGTLFTRAMPVTSAIPAPPMQRRQGTTQGAT